jgi:hypothetical protein
MRALAVASLAIIVLAMPVHADENGSAGDVAKVGDHQATHSGWAAFTELVKDVAQIVFWFTVSAVTILTYRRARKTLLQPIRTEVFKLQVEEVKPLFKIVVGKGEIELRSYFGFDELISANAVSLFDDYAHIRLGLKFDRENRPYMRSSSKIFRKDADGFRLLRVVRPGLPEMPKREPDNQTPEQRWAEYRYGIVHLMPTYVKRRKRLEQFLESPMLPAECVELVRSFRDNMEENAAAIFEVLTETAKELPTHFPTEKEMENAQVMWVENRYNRAFIPLKPDADKIVAFIRSHFGVDQLLKEV